MEYKIIQNYLEGGEMNGLFVYSDWEYKNLDILCQEFELNLKHQRKWN